LLLGSLFSFSAIPKFEILMFTASELLDKINSHIADLQFERTPKGLYDPVAYVLSMGGKRIRPVLMLMAYNLYKEIIELRPDWAEEKVCEDGTELSEREQKEIK
jgi:geranylgeranyl pyrophosphate synthase